MRGEGQHSLRGLHVEAEPSEEPNLAPLIDIVFILLIFFVVTTTFAKDLGIDIQRPSASTAVEVPTRVLRVAVGAGGEFTVAARPTSPWRLEEEVRHRLTHEVDKSVLVVADQHVEAGKLVEVVDACRRAGASSVALAVEEEP